MTCDKKQDIRDLNPGSEEAIAEGCTCPVMDNSNGKGWMGGVKNEDGNTLFVMIEDCTLHGFTK